MIKNFLFFLLFFPLLLFFSCQSLEEKKYRPKQELHTSLITDPPSLDPRIESDMISECLMQMLFTGLTFIDENDQIQLALAESYEISEDQTSYLFKLKKTQWSDGAPLTAYDFERGWKQQLSPDFPSPSAHLLYLIRGAREVKKKEIGIETVGIKALDEYTLKIDLVKPVPYFLQVLAFHTFYPIPPSFSSSPLMSKSIQEGKYISCGPFKLKKYQEGKEVILKKNSLYWDVHKVSLKALHFHIIKDANTALFLFEKGELDWLGAPLSELPTEAIPYLKKQNLLHIAPIAGIKMLAFNTKKVPFNNVKIRKAFSFAINRQEIIDNVIQLGNPPALGLIPPIQKKERWHSFFQDHDLNEARKLFNEGLEELDIKMSDFPELMISFNTSNLWSKILQAIQQQWMEAFGLSCKLEHQEWKVQLDKMSKGDFQIGKYGWACEFNDSGNLFELFKSSQRFNNPTEWEHPVYTELLDQSRRISDPQVRNELLEKAEFLFIEEMPIIPLFHDHCAFIQQSTLKRVHVTPLFAVDFRYAYFETAP